VNEETTLPHQNSSKGTGVDDGANTLSPSGFNIKAFTIQNNYGQVADISNLVQSFTISESLFSPAVSCSITIVDNVNFFNDYNLTGEERITIKIEKGNSTEPDRIETIYLEFIAKEYPNFIKGVDGINKSTFSIFAISSHAYISELQLISRSVKGSPVDSIQSIFEKDLGLDRFPRFRNESPCTTNFRGVITTQTPLDAVDWLRKKAFDGEKTPFFVYTNIANRLDTKTEYSPPIFINSWTTLVLQNQDPSQIPTFVRKRYISAPPGTVEYYKEKMSEIIDLQSTPRLDRLDQATGGGLYGNLLHVLDYNSKAAYTKKFDPDNKASLSLNPFSPSVAKQLGGSNQLRSGNKTVERDDIANSAISWLSVPPTPFSDGSIDTSVIRLNNLQSAKYYSENLRFASHSVTLNGDFFLNPGRKIALVIPKAIDPDKYNKRKNQNDSDLDTSLSGVYIISEANHVFSDGKYETKLNLIRDSL